MSKKYSLNKKDLQSIFTGFLIALAGATLTYLSEAVANTDFGDFTPIVVTVCAVLVNIGRKYLAGK